jgi:hypothetical protein
MITVIHPDGSCFREIDANGDSAFLAGDRSKNPYLFQLDSGWQISALNESSGKEYNVKISKLFHSPDEAGAGLQCEEDVRPLAAPAETLQKHFRWFYTYYSYKTVYAHISHKIPVSINDYLNAPEQKMWFQGDFSAYSGMNGIELKDEMDDVEKRFWKWYARNIYEAQFEAVIDFEKLSGGQHVSQLQEAKDTVFVILFKDFSLDSNTVQTVAIYKTLDKQLHTAYFSGLYKNNQSRIESLVKEKEAYLENLTDNLFSKEIEYKLVMPGKIIYANAPLQQQDTLVWKVNAFRFMPEDYVLVAESRTLHVWAFVVTFLLLALSVYCLIKSIAWRKRFIS